MNELQSIVEKYLNKKKSEVENEWAKHSEAVGEATARVETDDNSKGFSLDVTGRLICQGMKMWTLEYGKGSLMDRQNPHLSDYFKSEEFNKARLRHLLTVRTRPKEEYTDIDGETHMGSGIMGKGDGINIESAWGGYRWSFGKTKQVPVWAANHIIKEAMTKDNVATQDFKQELLRAFGQNVVIKNLPTRVVR